MEYTALGHTVGLAQRIEQLAAADRVYLSEHTASLVEGYLVLTDLGQVQVRGASRPLRVHELTGIGTAGGRLDVSRARGFSRFVGRDKEQAMLESALEQAFAGEGQVIDRRRGRCGKSRLCQSSPRQRAKDTCLHVAGCPRQVGAADARSSAVATAQLARERIAGKLFWLTSP